jgi:H+/Cl- antiporter ClcA
VEADPPNNDTSGVAGYPRLIGLAALIGVPAAFVAAGFLALVHQIEVWLWEDLPSDLGASSPPWYLVLALPVVGAGIVVVARTFLPGDGGHSPLEGFGGGVTPLAYGPGVALAALGTLPFGAVLGPEAPLIALGSVVGMALTPFVRLHEREQAVIATAGSFSAISALFGGPLVAGLLLVEGGLELGAALTPILLPGLVAAAIGYVIFIGIGDWGGLGEAVLSVPGLPPYEGTHLLDLMLAIGIGLLAAVVITVVRRGASWFNGPALLQTGMPGLLLLGGLATGSIALAARGLGGDSQDVLFSGQASIPALVNETSASVVLVLLAAKGLAYAVCLGCGFRGGPVFPAIFLGIALTMLTVIAFDTSPTFAVAVGAAAGVTAVTRLLFVSVLFAMLLVGSNGLDATPAAVLAAAAAWVAMKALDRRGAPATLEEPV